MPDKKAAPVDRRQKDRDAELAGQKEVEDAVFDATHGKDGKPIPIVVPETP